jgi:anti-anti-sigma factor
MMERVATTGDELTVDLQQKPGQLVLTVRGDLDLMTVGRLRAALHDACGDPRCGVTVDLSDVKFLDGLTFGAMATTARQLRHRGCHFVVRGLSPLQTRFLRLCGLQRAVTFA